MPDKHDLVPPQELEYLEFLITQPDRLLNNTELILSEFLYAKTIKSIILFSSFFSRTTRFLLFTVVLSMQPPALTSFCAFCIFCSFIKDVFTFFFFPSPISFCVCGPLLYDVIASRISIRAAKFTF